MLLRHITQHVRAQNWFAVTLDFLIVVVGILIALQFSNWNEARAARQQRDLLVSALVNDMRDHIAVQTRFIEAIDNDLAAWEAERAANRQPLPVIFRIDGSDSAPDTWGTFRQMPVATLLDPTSAVMLSYYYSELAGLSSKYVRYVQFVESRVLPAIYSGSGAFYSEGGELMPEYRANMDRLREHRAELARITAWSRCLVDQLERLGHLTADCSRYDFRLDGPISTTSGS